MLASKYPIPTGSVLDDAKTGSLWATLQNTLSATSFCILTYFINYCFIENFAIPTETLTGTIPAAIAHFLQLHLKKSYPLFSYSLFC